MFQACKTKKHHQEFNARPLFKLMSSKSGPQVEFFLRNFLCALVVLVLQRVPEINFGALSKTSHHQWLTEMHLVVQKFLVVWKQRNEFSIKEVSRAIR